MECFEMLWFFGILKMRGSVFAKHTSIFYSTLRKNFCKRAVSQISRFFVNAIVTISRNFILNLQLNFWKRQEGPLRYVYFLPFKRLANKYFNHLILERLGWLHKDFLSIKVIACSAKCHHTFIKIHSWILQVFFLVKLPSLKVF